jgi:hypothetical protein
MIKVSRKLRDSVYVLLRWLKVLSSNVGSTGSEVPDTYILNCTRIRLFYVGFEVFTAVVMKSTIFWDITLCSPLSVNRRFGRTQPPSSAIFDPEDGGDMFLRNVS